MALIIHFQGQPCPHKYGKLCANQALKPIICDKPDITAGFEL